MTDYIAPGVMTDPQEFAHLLDGLPRAPADVARVVQGLLIHEFWLDAYDVSMTGEQRQTVHLRKASDLLRVIAGKDSRPLHVVRAPGERVASNCRGFTVLAVTLLRHAGVPARARCGFGAYFGDKKEDHWVVEFRDGDRWRMLDAQLDEVQRRVLKIGFDVTDVTRDQFVIAGDGWQRCRAGKDDPDAYGLSAVNEFGYWWIASNMIRDVAALNNVEVLPWDCWGAMPEPEDAVDFELFDRLAAGDVELHDDERVRVPEKVFNAVRQVDEPLR